MNTRKAMTGVPSGPGTLHKCATRCRPVLIGLVVALMLVLLLPPTAALAAVAAPAIDQIISDGEGSFVAEFSWTRGSGDTNCVIDRYQIRYRKTGTSQWPTAGAANTATNGIYTISKQDSPHATSVSTFTDSLDIGESVNGVGTNESGVKMDTTGAYNIQVQVWDNRASSPTGCDTGTWSATSLGVQPADATYLDITPTELTLTEGGSAGTISVSLEYEPTKNVTVDTTWASGPVSVSPRTLTFTPTNYSTAQTVTVTPKTDTDSGTEAVDIHFGAGGAPEYEYHSVHKTVRVRVLEDRGARLIADPGALTVPEGYANDFQLTFSKAPSAAFTYSTTLAGERDKVSNPNRKLGLVGIENLEYVLPDDESVIQQFMGFFNLTREEADKLVWDQPRKINVQAYSDDDSNNETGAVTITVDNQTQALGYRGQTIIVPVTVIDQPSGTPSLYISPGSNLAVAEGGQLALSVIIEPESTATTTVTIESDSSAAWLNTSSLTILSGKGDKPEERPIYLTAYEDADSDDEIVTLTFTPSGGNIVTTPQTRTITINDGPPKVTFTTPSTVSGNITATFSQAVGSSSTQVTRFTNTNIDDLITLKQTDKNGDDIAFDATISGNVVTINPTSDLSAGTVYVAVSDQHWNDSLQQGSETDTTFAVVAVGNSPPPAQRSPGQGAGQGVAQFIGKTLSLSHVTADATGCLDVNGGGANNGQNVQTWACNQTKAQEWRLEQRTAGDHAGRYRLVSGVGDGSTYCLDNRGDFSDSDRMGIWSCVADTNGAAANQTFDLTASGDGWVLTFVRDSTSSMLWAERSATDTNGNVGQRTGTASSRAVWQLTDPDAAPSTPVPVPVQSDQSDPPDQPVLAEAQILAPVPSTPSFVGKRVILTHVDASSTGCLDVTYAAASNGQDVQTWECNSTKAQVWRVEQRTSGDHAGRYRLVSGVGDGSTYCLDNRGEFSDSASMDIWSCVSDTHGAAVNQSVDLTASGNGWVLTFVKDSASSVLWAERSGNSVSGNVGQRSSSTTGSSAVWQITEMQQPALTVADATVTEGAGEPLTFTISLDRAVLASDGTVSVDYATGGGTATAGADYTAASGTLTFATGESSKTVNVTVLDDAHDDSGETLDLVLSNVTGATIADGTGTGTIENSDMMPQAWAARFGRTVGMHITDAVSARLREEGNVESHLTVAGWRMPLGSRQKQGTATATDSDQGTRLLTGLAGFLGLNNPTGNAQGMAFAGNQNEAPWLNGSPRPGQNPGQALNLPDLRQALVGSAFRLNLNQSAGGSVPRLTAWGRVAHTQFDGQDGHLTMDGEVTTGTVGLDTQGDRWLAGIAIAHSQGDGGYTDHDQHGLGDLETTLTSLHPYLRYALTDRLTVWGLMGYGWGELTLTPPGETAIDTDTDFLMGAVGSRGLLLDPATTGGLQVATRLDAMFTRTTTEAVANLTSTDADAHRLRLMLEGSRRFAWAEGRHLTPTVEVGLRRDWGDAETGLGIEVGGRVQYADPTLGLTVEGAVRGLVAHEAEAYDEWGASGTIRLAPGVGGQGLALTLQPAWGAATASGVEALWGRQSTAGLAPRANQVATGSLAAEVGYGITAFDTGLVTPYAGTMLAESAGRTYRVGTRLLVPGQGATGLTMTLEGLRTEPTGLQPLNQGFRLQATWGF